MDSISEDSPLLPVIQLWDLIENLFDAYFELLFSFCVFSAYIALFGSLTNVLFCLGFLCWFNRSRLQLTLGAPPTTQRLLVTFGSILVAFFIVLFVRWVFLRRYGSPVHPAKAWLFPCGTTHTMLFPKKRFFSYSSLLVGVPVGSKSNSNDAGSVNMAQVSSLSPSCWPRKPWYDLNPADCPDRRFGCAAGLRKKLDNYLNYQGVDPSTYPHAFLVTSATFLGYHFNPVSIWYLYSEDKILSAIVLEMSNLFGERRPYFATRDFAAEAKQLSDPAHDGHQDTSSTKDQNTWKKDIHFSPFNASKGAYSLLASDPLGEDMEGFGAIDLTINLSSSTGLAKLSTRLLSEGSVIDPSSMGVIERLKLLRSWFWVGLVTFPRAIMGAIMLFVKHDPHGWYRSEPLSESLGRTADFTEKTLGVVFRDYLRFLVENSPVPLVVKYGSSGITERGEQTFQSPSAKTRVSEQENVRIKVLTPVFYPRFVGYAHDFEAIFCELVENGTLWADRPEVLTKIFLKKPSKPLHANTLTDFIAFKLIQKLRRRPQAVKQPLTPSSSRGCPPSAPAIDIRDFRISSMDAFVLGHNDPSLKSHYRAAVLRLFLADKFFFGYTWLLGAMESTLAYGLAWVVASLLTQTLTTTT